MTAALRGINCRLRRGLALVNVGEDENFRWNDIDGGDDGDDGDDDDDGKQPFGRNNRMVILDGGGVASTPANALRAPKLVQELFQDATFRRRDL